MIIPINDSSAEVIIRNAISNINMTIYTKLDSEVMSENSNYDILNNIINDKKKRSVSNTISSKKEESCDDSFILNHEEKNFERNIDNIVKVKSSEMNENQNNLSLKPVFFIKLFYRIYTLKQTRLTLCKPILNNLHYLTLSQT